MNFQSIYSLNQCSLWKTLLSLHNFNEKILNSNIEKIEADKNHDLDTFRAEDFFNRLKKCIPKKLT